MRKSFAFITLMLLTLPLVHSFVVEFSHCHDMEPKDALTESEKQEFAFGKGNQCCNYVKDEQTCLAEYEIWSEEQKKKEFQQKILLTLHIILVLLSLLYVVYLRKRIKNPYLKKSLLIVSVIILLLAALVFFGIVHYQLQAPTI